MSGIPDEPIPGMVKLEVDGLLKPCRTCRHPALLNRGAILAPGGITLTKETTDHDIDPMLGDKIPAGTVVTWVTPHAEDCTEAESSIQTQQKSMQSVEVELSLSPEATQALWGTTPEDPDDKAIREAHGLTAADTWEDETVYCRNGCGLSYSEIVGGKIRECRAGS
jgi:hypothetical protein